jgi:hypothetical protein
VSKLHEYFPPAPDPSDSERFELNRSDATEGSPFRVWKPSSFCMRQSSAGVAMPPVKSWIGLRRKNRAECRF